MLQYRKAIYNAEYHNIYISAWYVGKLLLIYKPKKYYSTITQTTTAIAQH